ncbi:GNAT family N-acetyltransferase [Paenibacillus doosanensis]|uniref:GNAT family N-acetyltransferase n=1 Tax=Paenibacillus doosanensis TaxID=1229154 RepID=UPI0021802FCA|nr:GNAT family N-acetyltransferase [Paenibacillus doosanensis]MCS7463988.1 GNAT family N-acetyltransferase [Paenibacillus doosanensis]
MNIRWLQAEDIREVEAMMADYPLQYPKFVRERYPSRWADHLRTKNRNACGYAVAVSEGERLIVGHAGYVFNQEAGMYEIVGVVVSSRYGRQGTGRALLRFVEERLRSEGAEQVFLHTLGHPGNEGTLCFYRSIGYFQTSHEIDFFRSGYHRVTFVRRLARDETAESALTIRPAVSEEERETFASILEEGAFWLADRGAAMWTKRQVTAESIAAAYGREGLYVAYVNGQAAGAVIVQAGLDGGQPDGPQADALRLHKLCVRRAYAGTGLSRRIVGWTIAYAREKGLRRVRLDCAADRPKLCAFYESLGFRKAGETLVLGKYPTAFYEYGWE